MYKRHLIKLLGLTVLAAVGVMAVSATAAQAKWLLLLNGLSVLLINLHIEGLSGFITAENGLKIECAGGLGIAHVQLSADHKTLTAVLSKTSFTGCKWVGSEKTCTINDGGSGVIKAKGEGTGTMKGEEVLVEAESTEFTTVLTEGVFCTIPEEEVVSGKVHVRVDSPLTDAKIKLGSILELGLKLGNSKVTALSAPVHISDADNPNATIGIHLVGL